MFNASCTPEEMRVAARNKMDSQTGCYYLGFSLVGSQKIAQQGEKKGNKKHSLSFKIMINRLKIDVGEYNLPRGRCIPPKSLTSLLWPDLELQKEYVEKNLEKKVYQTEISSVDYIEVMEYAATMFFQDMVEKMDDVGFYINLQNIVLFIYNY